MNPVIHLENVVEGMCVRVIEEAKIDFLVSWIDSGEVRQQALLPCRQKCPVAVCHPS
jgi:hypothetical protein